MNVTREPAELATCLSKARRDGAVIGLHATMGALHRGDKANIRRAAAECDVVAVTIFRSSELWGQPQGPAGACCLDDSLAAAEEAGANVVLAAGGGDVLPGGSELVPERAARAGERWEGAHRPGYFHQVASMVAKLLILAGPCYAYFGEKDYQQLVVVRRLVEDLSLPAVIVPCATVREPDGLALSSQSSHLGPESRQAAAYLYWALLAGKRVVEDDLTADGDAVCLAMVEAFERQDIFELDYAAVVSPVDLEPLSRVEGAVRLLIAARGRNGRLTDNLEAGESAGAAA